jgi:hypothetical protein
MSQLDTLFKTFPQARAGISSMNDLFLYNRIWTVYSIMYFVFVFVGAIYFVRFRAIGRTMLEIACWIGLVNACMDSLLSYAFLRQMNAVMSAVTSSMGVGLGSLNPLGIVTIIAGFFLWIIPSFGMIMYLRRPKLKELLKS